MRTLFIVFSLLSVIRLGAQHAAEPSDQDKTGNQVTDIVVVFKMHVDIGYTNWAEGVLQKYCNDMLDETLRSIDETSRSARVRTICMDHSCLAVEVYA